MTVHERPVFERPASEMNDPALREYLNAIGRIPLLSAADELRLGRLVAEGQRARARLDSSTQLSAADRAASAEKAERGEDARSTMIRANLRLVVSIARRVGGHHVPLLDLIQEGNIGLMRAVEKFDHRRRLRFSTYATWWIRQAVARAAPDHRTVRVPPHSYEQMIRCRRLRAEIEERYGRPATDLEIADALGVTEARVRELMRFAASPLTLDPGDTGIDVADDGVTDPWVHAHREDVRARVRELLSSLPAQARTVVRLRFGFDGPPASLAAVGEALGLPTRVVRRIEEEALASIEDSHRVGAVDLDEPA